MGLDSVELLIRFENAFGIAIPDEVAAELTTPRKVTDYIFTQVNRGNQSASRWKFVARNYVLIDFENIRPSPMPQIAGL